MTKYCPKCGEPVPSSAKQCPKCYAKITDDVKEVRFRDDPEVKKERSDRIAMALAIIPGFLGILGLGLVYKDRSNQRWMYYLGLGLAFFLMGNFLLLTPTGILVGILKTIIGLGIMLIYLLIFIVSVLDTASGFHIHYMHR